MNKSGHLSASGLHSSINGNMLTANRGHAFVLAPRKKLLCAHLFTITVTGGFITVGGGGFQNGARFANNALLSAALTTPLIHLQPSPGAATRPEVSETTLI